MRFATWLALVLGACTLRTAAAEESSFLWEQRMRNATHVFLADTTFRSDDFRRNNATEQVEDDAPVARSAANEFLLDVDSPRALLDVAEERSSSDNNGSPRLFKKLRKFIGERLLWGLMGLVLVVKLLSLKFMFLLPVIMGVAAAKKLLLKVILFVFPFLGHLFKLCPYYAPTKYHHHHHQIAHLHKLPPHVHDLGHHQQHHHHHHHHDEDDFGYYSDGPGFVGNEIRRDHNDINPDEPYGGRPAKGAPQEPQKIRVGPLSPTEIENMVLKAEKEAMLKARLQEEQKRVEIENKRLQDKIKASLKLQEKLKIQSMVAKQTATYHPPPPPPPQLQPPPLIFPSQQAQISAPYRFTISSNKDSQGAAAALHSPDLTSSGVVVDSFYSPILQKIDRIFRQLLINDESCRERLVCNMYSNPEQYSPHSNLISAELSRDANELQKPTTSNVAVIRFYKYVQAARDGQDKRDCATLYPKCTLHL